MLPMRFLSAILDTGAEFCLARKWAISHTCWNDVREIELRKLHSAIYSLVNVVESVKLLLDLVQNVTKTGVLVAENLAADTLLGTPFININTKVYFQNV